MSLLLLFTAILLTLVLIVAGLLGWFFLRLYVFHVFLLCRAGRIRMGIELRSKTRKLLSASVHNEGTHWHASFEARKRPVWQRTWTPPTRIRWYRILHRIWRLWKHPKRSTWVEVTWRLLREIYQQVTIRRVSLIFRIGLPSYPQDGYLAAVAYPLDFTLFRALGIWRPQVVPDFSATGFAFENHIYCTFRGYQLLKPGYHFLSSPEVSGILKDRLSQRFRRISWLATLTRSRGRS